MNGLSFRLFALSLFAALPSTAIAQFNNQWLTFVKDQSRIVDPTGAPATAVLTDAKEKDFAWGDVNHDGYVDLVVVRKQPLQTIGKEPNFLLMNEGGKLVDRTAQYASASNVVGDMGFLTPTNDRDVQIADVTGDGWEDIVTATTLGLIDPVTFLYISGDSYEISHPRVYVNLGTSGGVWQGFRFESGRIPQLYQSSGGAQTVPNFCSVSVGDVTGDGSPDLYFANYFDGAHRLQQDRLLINNGAGFFTDSYTTRLNSFQLHTGGFGTSSEITDMNGDGRNDIVAGQIALTGGSSVALNRVSPDPIGNFFSPPLPLFQPGIGGTSTYHIDIGDLNNDGWPDMMSSQDGPDTILFHTGTFDLGGRVIWGPLITYQFLSGFDDGSAGNILIADLNNDGWPETLHSDADVAQNHCLSRRAHIYHNPGVTPGSMFQLREEAEMAGTGGWKGAVGLPATELADTFDIAAFDLDNDGDLDLIFGRCAHTTVFINQLNQPTSGVCEGDGAGTACPCANNSPVASGAGCLSSLLLGGQLRSSGVARVSADTLTLIGTQVPNGAGQYFQGTALAGGGAGSLYGDGLLCLSGTIVRLGIKFAANNASIYPEIGIDLSVSVQGAVIAGNTYHYQLWYRDADPVFCTIDTFNLTNAVSLTWLP